MKPFDLELAKQKHPVQTRDGRSVRIICYNREDKDYPIVALVKNHFDKEIIEEYTINGKYDIHVLRSDADLFMAPTKKEGWINLFKDKGYTRLAGSRLIHDSKEAALYSVNNSPDYVTTIKIEWEE